VGGEQQHTTPSRHTARSWIRPHYASFNGLRGLAVLLVFIHHFGGPIQSFSDRYLWTGVDLFFVLSGFLITGILYDSLGSTRYFRDFYVRRALRIFPVFFGFFLVLAVAVPLFHLHIEAGLLDFVFYFGNLTFPFSDQAHHNFTIISAMHHGHLVEIGNIGHLWSLCVEEQFYLVWPAVVWLVRDRKKLMALCLWISAASIGLRFYLFQHASAQELSQFLIHWSTYTRCDTLLAGAWLALYLRGRELSQSALRRASIVLFFGSAALLAGGIWRWRGGHGIFRNPFLATVGYTLIALAAVGLVLRALDDTTSFARALRWRPLSQLGVISYGFYFFHCIAANPWHRLSELHPRFADIMPLIVFVTTVPIAWLSFRYWESPFLRLKSVLAPQQRASAKVARTHLSEPRPKTPPSFR
jgi:peptidoglycan/LPS O-acetylase OafA/YrhL